MKLIRLSRDNFFPVNKILQRGITLNIPQTKTFTVISIITLLSAVILSGGCGGSGGSDVVLTRNNTSQDITPETESQDVDPNGPESYSNEIAEKLVALDNIYSLSDFVKDSSTTAGKGDVLLWYQEDGEDITAYPNYLDRLRDALYSGAVLAFADITAEDIDKLTEDIPLPLPDYLPDNATSEEKAEIEDFYAVAVRADSEDSEVENAYTYFGVDLASGRA